MNTLNKNRWLFAWLMLLTGALVGCGGGGATSSGTDVKTYMSSLPQWADFAPKALPEDNEGVEVVDDTNPPTVDDLVDPDGNLKVCTSEKVDFYNTPEEYVMFAPPTNILYPGAMIVGRSLRDGANAGELLPIDVAQRTPVDVTISACLLPNNGNTRRVQPTLAAVNGAVADILAEASMLSVDCTNPQGVLKVDTFRNENQRALKAGMSGRYFGFSGKASGSYNKTKVENSVAAIFRETLYTVDVSAPQTPAGWFSSDFTSDLLQQQIDANKMGPDNVPAYVARVSYGRILTATLTSTHTEADMRFAMEFKYQNPVASVTGDAATRSQNIRDDSSMTVAYLGGSAEATAAMLKSNDWTQYFGVPATAGDAVPISFELRSVSDNQPAVVQELTSYDRVTCNDKLGDGETFVLEAKQQFTPGFSATGQTVAVGDINGDGAKDIVWAATALSARGEFAVALANGDGTFAPLIKGEDVDVNNVVGDFSLLLKDVDNDGRDDIIFNTRQGTGAPGSNSLFVSFYKDNAGPGFVYSAPQTLSSSSGWDTYRVYAGQMDAKNGMDIVWNNTPNHTTLNRSYIAYAADTTTLGFDLTKDVLFTLTAPIDQAGNFSGAEYTHLADFNGDGHDDLMWQNIDINGNWLYTRFGTDTGLEGSRYQNFGNKWTTYVAMAGDSNGDGIADLVEPRSKSTFSSFGIYIGEGSGVAVGRAGNPISRHTFKYRNRDPDDIAIKDLLVAGAPPDMYLADVNGDGAMDLLINDKGYQNSITNNIGVGLAVVGGSEFTFTRVAQTHPVSTDWSQYRLLVGDVTGEGRDDVLWISNATTNTVYIGTARGN